MRPGRCHAARGRFYFKSCVAAHLSAFLLMAERSESERVGHDSALTNSRTGGSLAEAKSFRQ